MIQWISVADRLPEESGKYIVEGVSTIGTTRRLETNFVKTEKRGHFTCAYNVLKWLEEKK